MNLILFSVTTFAVLDYFYRFMRFVSTDLAKIAKFLCFYSKSGLCDSQSGRKDQSVLVFISGSGILIKTVEVNPCTNC